MEVMCHLEQAQGTALAQVRHSFSHCTVGSSAQWSLPGVTESHETIPVASHDQLSLRAGVISTCLAVSDCGSSITRVAKHLLLAFTVAIIAVVLSSAEAVCW